MDIEKLEKLEKLNELKEKGLLTQEEFDAEKKKLLQPAKPKIEKKIEILSQENIKENSSNENSEKNRKFSWKNFFLSLFITVIFLLLFGFIAVSLGHSTKDFKGIYQLLTLFGAALFTLYAIKKETYKYKNGSPAWGIFLAVAIFGPIGIWLASYQLLQIKSGFLKLKDSSEIKKRNKIATTIGIVFLSLISLFSVFLLYTKARYVAQNKNITARLSDTSISPSQKDIYILKQTVKNIKKTFSKGFYTGLANTPNLSPSATHSGGGRILYSDFDTSWIEIDYQDVPIELCIQIAQQDYSFLADYEGIFMRIYGPNNEGTHEIYVNWEDGILSKEKAQQMCQACGGNCTISWIFGPRENEDEDYSDEYDSEQVDEVVWNDGKPQDATQAYRDASAEDRLSFNATFTGCLAQEKFNMQMQDALPLEAQFAMAFSGGSNTSRQCSCIFNAVKEYLGDEEFQQARKFRQQGRDGSADKIYEKALPAAFGSCF